MSFKINTSNKLGAPYSVSSAQAAKPASKDFLTSDDYSLFNMDSKKTTQKTEVPKKGGNYISATKFGGVNPDYY